jgi:hypothetical protein
MRLSLKELIVCSCTSPFEIEEESHSSGSPGGLTPERLGAFGSTAIFVRSALECQGFYQAMRAKAEPSDFAKTCVHSFA